MENASKALIIAGAVLIAIILISIGIRVMNSTSEIVDEANSQSNAVATQMFNSKITPYLGNSVEGAKVKALLSYIITVDSSESDPIYVNAYKYDKKTKLVTAAHPTTGGSITKETLISRLQTMYNNISTLSTYKVEITSGCNTYKNSGYKSDGTIGCISIILNKE